LKKKAPAFDRGELGRGSRRLVNAGATTVAPAGRHSSDGRDLRRHAARRFGSVLVWGASRFRGPDRRPDGVGQLAPPSYVLHINAGKLSDGTFVVKLRPAFDGVPYDAFENGIIHAVAPPR
jgi:hypothetical protein